jgi:hypothetical protein
VYTETFWSGKMNLEELVIELHNIARAVEQSIGQGQLSEDIRKCADRLQSLIKTTK